MSKSQFLLSVAALLAGMWLTGCGTLASRPSPIPLPTSTAAPVASLDGATLLQQRCNACHPATYINGLRGTADQWAGLVSVMVQNGADLNPQEEQVLVKFLAQNDH